MRLSKTLHASLKASVCERNDIWRSLGAKTGLLLFGMVIVVVGANTNAHAGVAKFYTAPVRSTVTDEVSIVDREIALGGESATAEVTDRDRQATGKFADKSGSNWSDVFTLLSSSHSAATITAAKYSGRRSMQQDPSDATDLVIAQSNEFGHHLRHHKPPTPTPTATVTPAATPTPVQTATPVPPTPTPTATVTPTATLTPANLTTTDSLLNLGTVTTVAQNNSSQNGAANVVAAALPSDMLWELVASPWGVNSGSVGGVTMTYSGAGSVVTTVNYSALKPSSSGVNGYPFIFYGGDQWGDQIGGQPPQFPAQLSSLSALNFDVTYALSGVMGGDTDVLFDEWLIPTKTYTGGSGGAMEVEILPYCNFAYGCQPCPLIKTFTEPVTVNGTLANMSFAENSCTLGAGGDVLFSPTTPSGGFASAEIQFNMLDFLNEAAKTAGLSGWSVAGVEFGTEFGDASSLNYTLTTSKLQVSQVQ